jgi:hypothetical protein
MCERFVTLIVFAEYFFSKNEKLQRIFMEIFMTSGVKNYLLKNKMNEYKILYKILEKKTSKKFG